MQFLLTADGLAISNQLRAYAEYRFFTKVARHASTISVVQITVRCDGDVYFCTAAVDETRAEGFTVQARAAHPNAAIDKVADRAARLLSRRDRKPVSP
jgi:ribosome-associated translation inhibitor RaiA